MLQSTYELLNWPDEIPVRLFVFGFICILVPYIDGTDFGIFRVPSIAAPLKQRCKYFGPVFSGIVLLGFFPLWEKGGDPPPGLKPEVFESHLSAYRKSQADAINGLFIPANATTEENRYKNQLAIVEGALADGDLHARSQKTTDAISRLINDGTFPTTIPGLSNADGPNDSSVDAWIQSLEDEVITVSVDGKDHSASIRWWLIYVGVRHSIENGNIAAVLEIARSSAAVRFVAPAVFMGMLQTPGTRDPIAKRVRDNYDYRIVTTDAIIKRTYKQWHKDNTTYDHTKTVADFNAFIHDSIRNPPEPESVDETWLNEIKAAFSPSK